MSNFSDPDIRTLSADLLCGPRQHCLADNVKIDKVKIETFRHQRCENCHYQINLDKIRSVESDK